IAKTANGQTKQYAYDGGDIVLTFAGSGALAALAHRYLDGPLVDQVFADESVSANNVFWPLPDRLGTVRDIVGSNGASPSRLVYDSYGRIVSGIPSDDYFAFTGREWDKETGQYYFRARYYDPNTGDFLSQDPLGFAAGDPNLYRYIGNGPTNATDP